MRGKHTRTPAQDLRAAIDRLPRAVVEGVLEGIERRPIVAGAHADEQGRVCPMMAATVDWEYTEPATIHLAQEVAWAWDRYAEATRSGHPASRRQLLALGAMLEASLLARPPAEEPTRNRVAARARRLIPRLRGHLRQGPAASRRPAHTSSR